MTLFVRGNFVSRSGVALSWKIEADALTADDWACLAEIYAGLPFPPFGKVIGIAGGGVPFAIALRKTPPPARPASSSPTTC